MMTLDPSEGHMCGFLRSACWLHHYTGDSLLWYDTISVFQWMKTSYIYSCVIYKQQVLKRIGNYNCCSLFCILWVHYFEAAYIFLTIKHLENMRVFSFGSAVGWRSDTAVISQRVYFLRRRYSGNHRAEKPTDLCSLASGFWGARRV